MSEWRVGRKLGRTLYEDEKLVGMMDTPELAERVCEAMNDWGAHEKSKEAAEVFAKSVAEQEIQHLAELQEAREQMVRATAAASAKIVEGALNAIRDMEKAVL